MVNFEKSGFDQETVRNAGHRVFTYEKWLDPNTGYFPSDEITIFYVRENGDWSTDKKEGGKLTFFILPKTERLKIEQRKAEILEHFVKAYTDALIGCFESRYEGWQRGEALINEELEQVEALLFEGMKPIKYAPRCVGYWLNFKNDGIEEGTICAWNRLLRQDKVEIHSSISEYHASLPVNELSTKEPTLHFVVAAKAFDHYREYLESKLKENEPSAPKESKNPDFTLARQVLAVHYLLEFCQVKGIDHTKKAAFIEFLTEKNPKNIYEAVRSPLATKAGDFRRKDLKYIRVFFDNLEMRGIVQMIDNELDKPE